MKKRFLSFVLCCLLLLTTVTVIVSCDNSEEINICVPDGAPALAVAELLENNRIDDTKINVTITTGENVRAQILNKQADIAICPTNMAATLYCKGADYKLVTANLFGLLYLVGNINANSLDDLKGQLVYNIGKGSTPEFVFKKILAANGIEYVDDDKPVDGKVAIKYFEKGEQIIPLLKDGIAKVAILGEPAVTKSEIKQLFDLQQLWNEATGLDGSYPQAGLFVNDNLLQNKPAFVDKLIQRLESNVEYIANNSEKVANLLVSAGSSDFNGITFTSNIIQRCNVRCKNASNCKEQLVAYFTAIKTINPSFELPDDDFYAR